MSTATIILNARIAEFEAKVNRAVTIFQTLSSKGVSVSKAVDRSFKTITLTAKNSAKDIEKSFNALSIKSDFSLEVQTKALARNAKFFKAQYYKIKLDGESSAKEITRAYQAMHIKLRQLSQQPIGLTQVDTDHTAALVANKKFNDQRIANDKLAYWARIKAEKANLLAYEASENEAFRINQKFNEAKALADQKAAQKRIASLNKIIKFENKIAADKRAALDREVAASKRAYEKISNYRIKAQMEKITGGQLAGPEFTARLKSQMMGLGGVVEGVKKGTKGISDNIGEGTKRMNLFNLASVASILKIQVMFTLVNNVMSAVARMPGMAMEAVESFDAASISNAAMITSMQKGLSDIGAEYRKNKIYADAVTEVLIKMDAKTAASGKNLMDMNRKFVQQGVLIDVNNKKQVEGFLSIANALATLTSGDPNANLQYPQEIGAFLRGENRPSNKLFQLLNNMDNGKLREHLNLWRKVSNETGNMGYVLEQVGPMLLGFKAAQEDIERLWETTKSTMVTIRDDVLRRGFRPEYELIVKKVREIGEYAEQNKEKLAGMLRGTFENLNKIVTMLPEIAAGIGLITIAQMRWNKTALLNPYVRTLVAIEAINIGLKQIGKVTLPFGGKMPDMSFGGMLDTAKGFVANVKNIANSLRGLRPEIIGVSDALAQSHFTAPSMWSAHGETMPEGVAVPKGIKLATKIDEKAIRAAERLKNKLIEVRKSENDIFIAQLESTSNLAIAVNESKYQLMLISDKNYLDKKHELSIASAKREVSSTQLALDEAIAAQASLAKDIPNRLFEEAKLTLKVNNANIALIKSKDALRVLNTKISEETGTLFLKQLDLQNKLATSEINNKLKMVTVNEKLFKLTSGEAAATRINLLRERLSLQGEELSLNLRLSDAEQARYEQQLIGIQDTNNAIDEQNKKLSDQTAIGAMSNAMNEYQQTVEDVGTQMKDTFTNAFSEMEDAMVEFMKTGKLSFRSLVDSVLEDLIRIQARKITATLAGGLGSALSFGASLFGGMSTLPSTPAGFGTTPTPVWNLPGRAFGGPVTAGQTYIVNENRKTDGPEYFTPGVSGVITPGSKMSSNQISVPVTIENGNGELASRLRNEIEDTVERVLREVS